MVLGEGRKLEDEVDVVADLSSRGSHGKASPNFNKKTQWAFVYETGTPGFAARTGDTGKRDL